MMKKILVLGAEGAGKTQLVTRVVRLFLPVNSVPSTGDNYHNVEDNTGSRFDLLEVSGCWEDHGFLKEWLNTYDVFILVYNTADKHSFEQIINYYLPVIFSTVLVPIARKSLLLVANQQNTSEQVNQLEGRELARRYNMLFHTVNVKTVPYQHIEQIFFATLTPNILVTGPLHGPQVELFVVGIYGVGKTSFILKLLGSDYILPDGLYRKLLFFNQKRICLTLKEVSNVGQYIENRSHAIRNNRGFVLVYDVGNYNSFDQVPKIFSQIRKEEKHIKSMPTILMANKCESTFRQVVPNQKGKRLAKKHGWPFFEVSSLVGTNVCNVSRQLAEMIVGYKENNRKQTPRNLHNLNGEQKKPVTIFNNPTALLFQQQDIDGESKLLKKQLMTIDEELADICKTTYIDKSDSQKIAIFSSVLRSHIHELCIKSLIISKGIDQDKQFAHANIPLYYATSVIKAFKQFVELTGSTKELLDASLTLNDETRVDFVNAMVDEAICRYQFQILQLSTTNAVRIFSEYLVERIFNYWAHIYCADVPYDLIITFFCSGLVYLSERNTPLQRIQLINNAQHIKNNLKTLPYYQQAVYFIRNLIIGSSVSCHDPLLKTSKLILKAPNKDCYYYPIQSKHHDPKPEEKETIPALYTALLVKQANQFMCYALSQETETNHTISGSHALCYVTPEEIAVCQHVLNQTPAAQTLILTKNYLHVLPFEDVLLSVSVDPVSALILEKTKNEKEKIKALAELIQTGRTWDRRSAVNLARQHHYSGIEYLLTKPEDSKEKEKRTEQLENLLPDQKSLIEDLMHVNQELTTHTWQAPISRQQEILASVTTNDNLFEGIDEEAVKRKLAIFKQYLYLKFSELFAMCLLISKGVVDLSRGTAQRLASLVKFGGSLIPAPYAHLVVSIVVEFSLKLHEDRRLNQYNSIAKQVVNVPQACQLANLIADGSACRYQFQIVQLTDDSLEKFAEWLLKRSFNYLVKSYSSGLRYTMLLKAFGAGLAFFVEDMAEDLSEQSAGVMELFGVATDWLPESSSVEEPKQIGRNLVIGNMLFYASSNKSETQNGRTVKRGAGFFTWFTRPMSKLKNKLRYRLLSGNDNELLTFNATHGLGYIRISDLCCHSRLLVNCDDQFKCYQLNDETSRKKTSQFPWNVCYVTHEEIRFRKNQLVDPVPWDQLKPWKNYQNQQAILSVDEIARLEDRIAILTNEKEQLIGEKEREKKQATKEIEQLHKRIRRLECRLADLVSRFGLHATYSSVINNSHVTTRSNSDLLIHNPSNRILVV